MLTTLRVRKCLQGLTSPLAFWIHSLLTHHSRTGNTGRRVEDPVWGLERQFLVPWLPSPLTSKANSWELLLAEGGEGNRLVEPPLRGEVRPLKWKLGQSRRPRGGKGKLWGQPYDLNQPWSTYHFTLPAPGSLTAALPGDSSSCLPAPAAFHSFPYHSYLCVLSAFTSFLPTLFIKLLLYTRNSRGDQR